MKNGEIALLVIGTAILAYIVGLKNGSDAAHATRDAEQGATVNV